MPLLTLLLIWAVFLQVCLTLFILFKMRGVRVRAFQEGAVTIEQVAVDHSVWPDYVRKVQNSYISQFELPVLFYLSCILVLIFGMEDWVIIILSWLFVASRFVHFYIHTGTNRIKHRFRAFAAGLACVAIQWIYIMVMFTYTYFSIAAVI